MKSSQEWHVGTISVPPLQRGTMWCPRVGTSRLQKAHESVIKLRRKHSEPEQHRKWRKKWESHPRQAKPAAAFKAVSSSMPDFFQCWRRERDSQSRWGEPHLLSGQAPRLSGLPPTIQSGEPLVGLFHQLTPSAF